MKKSSFIRNNEVEHNVIFFFNKHSRIAPTIITTKVFTHNISLPSSLIICLTLGVAHFKGGYFIFRQTNLILLK